MSERERREEEKHRVSAELISRETQMFNASSRSREIRDPRCEGRPFPLFSVPFPSCSFFSSFLPSSRLVQPFRGTVTRARNTKGCAASFYVSLSSSLTCLSTFFLPSEYSCARSLILALAKGGGRRRFSHSNRPETARTGVTSWRKERSLAQSRTQYVRTCAPVCVRVHARVHVIIRESRNSS